MVLEHGLVQLLDEIHRLEIACIPILIGLPVTFLARVVEIEHISHSIDAQAINMELLEPEKRIGYQEALHLRTPIIKIRGTPFPVFSPLLIVRLIQRLPVKMAQPLIVLAEMAGNPVHDNRNPVFMCLVHQVHEILRLAIPAGHGIIAGCLIAPGAVIGMLTKRHEFNMRIVHILHIANELVGQLPVAQIAALKRAPPGTEMHLIGKHRHFIGALLLLLFIPFLIVPFIAGKIIDLGCGLRLFLGKKTIRIGLHDMRPAPLRPDRVLVDGLLRQPLNEHAPDLTVPNFLHFMAAGIPVVEVPHHTYRFGMRCPDGKPHPLLAILLSKMSPEHLIRMKVCSLMEQIQIKFAQIRCLHFKLPLCHSMPSLWNQHWLDIPDIGCIFADGAVG